MKTKVLLFFLFIFGGIYSLQAQEWGYVSTLTNEMMRKICTQGLDTVYIVGDNGLIARSTDKGETWGKQYFPTKVALNDIIFIDHYTGFAVGEQGTILKTADAGETWKQITLNVTPNFSAIAATGLDNIWAVGDSSLILHSTDARETWSQVNILPENDIQLLDIAFRGNLGYFTGDNSTVYKTVDKGTTWNPQTLTEQSVSNTFYAINIMENRTYIMSDFNTISGYGFFYTDSQNEWNYYRMGGDIDWGRMSLFFLDDNQGFSSSTINAATTGNNNMYDNEYKPLILRTNDGGMEWSNDIYMYGDLSSINKGQYPINPQYLDIRFTNDTLGYAIFGQSLLRYPKLTTTINTISTIEGTFNLILTQLYENELLIKSKNNTITSVDIFDTSGKKMIYKQFQNPPLDVNIDISNLPKGVYLIKVIQKDNIISTEKFLIR